MEATLSSLTKSLTGRKFENVSPPTPYMHQVKAPILAGAA